VAPDTQQLNNTTLEDCTVLDGIQEMVRARAAALGLRLSPVPFYHCATTLDRLKVLRDEVYTLAPNFINMDYPYWEQGWASFPKMYSVTWQKDLYGEFIKVNDLAMGGHPIDTLPQNCSTFDQDSVQLYRTYLKNLVYWLEKFRYIKATKTWYDRSYKREWDWTQSWDGVSWRQAPYATVNGTHVEGVTDAELRSVQEGLVMKEGPVPLPIEGYFQVTWQEYGHMRKFYDFKDSYSDPKPLTEALEGEHVYKVGKAGDGVPGNLTTANPTAYEADLLWFIVPESNKYSEHKGKGLLVSDTQDWLVTDKEHLVFHRWGPHNEYSAWEWHAVAGTGQHQWLQKDFVNGEFRETYNRTNVWSTPGYNRRSTRTTVKTNWTPTGDRSAVVENTTEQDTDTNQPYENNRLRQYFEPQTFGLVHFDPEERPCFNAGTIAPHGSLTYHVCDQDSLPAPSYQFKWDYVPNDTYDLGIDDWSDIDIDASTLWYPVLDLKSYTIPEPEEPEG
jgi:hypothetical protein